MAIYHCEATAEHFGTDEWVDEIESVFWVLRLRVALKFGPHPLLGTNHKLELNHPFDSVGRTTSGQRFQTRLFTRYLAISVFHLLIVRAPDVFEPTHSVLGLQYRFIGQDEKNDLLDLKDAKYPCTEIEGILESEKIDLKQMFHASTLYRRTRTHHTITSGQRGGRAGWKIRGRAVSAHSSVRGA